MPTEFLSVEEITKRYGSAGIQDFAADYLPAGSWTDDTDMSIAIPRALLIAGPDASNDEILDHIAEAFVEWYEDPASQERGPGRTCRAACWNLQSGGKSWREWGIVDSKVVEPRCARPRSV